MLAIGDTAPDFQLKDQFGSTVTLGEIAKNGDTILYFYPADFSPVCTAEACAFRDSFTSVSELSARIIGISPQSVSSHRRFSDAFKLPFPLLSDTRKKVIRAYGVDGPFGFGVRRVTFLLDSSRTIVNRVISELSVGSHTELLKKTLREHQAA